MKLYPITLFLLCTACIHKKSERATSETKLSVQTDTALLKDNRLFYAKQDTVTIISESGYDTLHYSKKDFDNVVDYFPELHEDIPSHPDIAYAKSGAFKDIIDENGGKKHISFGSEVGQDYFYILYAYFHPPPNKDAVAMRKRLIEGYNIINGIFNSLHGFGTFFVHQYRRIPAYAAYYTSSYTEEVNSYFLPDSKEEKTLFLQMLKLEIINNIKNNNDIPGASMKKQRVTELLAKVTGLDSLITTQYILHRICEFRYSYYQ